MAGSFKGTKQILGFFGGLGLGLGFRVGGLGFRVGRGFGVGLRASFKGYTSGSFRGCPESACGCLRYFGGCLADHGVCV